MLRIELIGNLGGDPEQRFTQNGATVVTFRVAVNSRRKGPDGDQVERTDWFRVRTMGQRADYVARLQKGARVFVVGRLDIGEYQSREGETRTSYDVWADDVVGLSAREDAAGGNGYGERSAVSQRVSTPAREMGGVEGEPDELPF